MNCAGLQSEHQLLLVDAHVHYHPCFHSRQFLDAAASNFHTLSIPFTGNAKWMGYLMLADTHASGSLSLLLEASHHQLQPEWRLERSEETCSVLAYRHDSPKLVLVAGRQIVTAEGIELLALATNGAFREHRPFNETLRAIVDADAIPVIPWGFGKWAFRRGRLLAEFVRSLGLTNRLDRHEVFLGDNGGRTRCLGQPRLFKTASAAGMRILPGSDPLPFASQVSRPGSYGFVLTGQIDYQQPATSLKLLLGAARTQPKVFGRLQRFHQFIASQLAMQMQKRTPHALP